MNGEPDAHTKSCKSGWSHAITLGVSRRTELHDGGIEAGVHHGQITNGDGDEGPDTVGSQA